MGRSKVVIRAHNFFVLPASIRRAPMSEPSTAAEQVLNGHRAYLQFQARVLVSPWLRNHLDLSGIINETLLKAWQAWDRFHAWSEEEKTAWLRTVLANLLRDEIAKVYAQCRDVRRNRSLEAALDESSTRLAEFLAAPQSSPSAAVERHDQQRRVAEAVERLPEAQREALLLQRWHGWSLTQIAEQMSRTPAAVTGLLHRALKQLKQELGELE
jgi:RNA polymerase sigma-70 factor (ECF subfamily)